MPEEQKFKVTITGDASSLEAAASKGAEALRKIPASKQEQVEVAEALKRIGNDAKQMAAETSAAAEKGKLFGSQLGEMKKIAGQLSQEFPIAGLALRAFLNPIGAVAAVSIGAFVAAKQAIADYLALFKELPNVTTAWTKKFEDWSKVVNDGAKSWREYAKAYDAAMNPKSTTASAADKEVAALKARGEKQVAGLDRGAALADAQDELAVAQGRLSPAEAAVRRAQRAQGYGAAKDRIAADVASGEISIRAREEKRLRDELALKVGDTQKLRADASQAAAADATAKQKFSEAQERLKNADAAKAEADAAALPYEDITWKDYIPFYGQFRQRTRLAARGQREAMRGVQSQAEDEYFQRARMAAGAGVAAEAAQGAAQSASADVLMTAQSLTQVRGLLPGLQTAARESAEANQIGAVVRALTTQARLSEAERANIEAAEKRIAQLEARARQ